MPAAVKRFLDAAIAWALSLRLVRAFLLYGEKRGPALADGVTYRALFSVFAAVVLGFSIAGQWLADNPVAWDALVEAVDAVIPGLLGADGVVAVSDLSSGLRIASALSLVALVLASIGAIGSLRSALRILGSTVYDDSFWLWVLARNFAFAVGIGVAIVLTAALTYFGTGGTNLVLDWLGWSSVGVASQVLPRLVGVIVVFALDAAIIAAVFLLLSGMRPPARPLWAGALIGALALTVLQQLSGLFVAGASANVLLASFGSLIALLLWMNLSAQAVLFSCTYIIVATEEERFLGGAHPPVTFAQRRLRRAITGGYAASMELLDARASAALEDAGSGRGYARGMAIARLHGGPLDGQILPLDSREANSLIVPYGEGQVVYHRAGDLVHTGDHDGPTEAEFHFVEATDEIGPSED